MGRLSTKLKIMTMALQAQAMYVAQFASFSELQLGELDQYFVTLLRGYAHTSGQVASAIILEPQLGGYLEPMWDQVTRRKQALLQRATLEGGHTRLAMESLMMRHARQEEGSNDPTRRADPFTLDIPRDKSWWAAHLILDGARSKPPRRWRFDPGKGSPTCPPLPSQLSEAECGFLSEFDVLSLDELIDWNRTLPAPSTWMKTEECPPSLLKKVQTRAKGTRPLPFCPARGQVLYLEGEDPTTDTVIQLMGWTSAGGWQARQWLLQPQKKAGVKGRIMEENPEVITLLAGSSLRFTPAELAHRVRGRVFSKIRHTESAETHYVTVVAGLNISFTFPEEEEPIFTPVNYAPILTPVVRHQDMLWEPRPPAPAGLTLPPAAQLRRHYGTPREPRPTMAHYTRTDQASLPIPPWVRVIRTELDRLKTNITVMVSDASARRQSGPISSIFALAPTPYDNSTVVMIANHSYVPDVTPALIALRITRIPTTLMAQDAELLGALAMATIRRFTPADEPMDCGLDCMAVLQKTGLNQTPRVIPRSWKVEPADQLTLAARLMNSNSHAPMKHVPAHLDERKLRKDGSVKREAIPRDNWKPMEHLQWAADLMADPTDSAMETLSRHNASPQVVVEITAQELHDSVLHPGRFWQTAESYHDLQRREEEKSINYFLTRTKRSKDGIPWDTAQTGLLLEALRTHPLWKYPHHRPGILRYLWDYIPHGRNQAKSRKVHTGETHPDDPPVEPEVTMADSPSPPSDPHTGSTQLTDAEPVARIMCQLCSAGPDDMHHLLVECEHPELSRRRGLILASLSREYAEKTRTMPPAVGAYIDHLLTCLHKPDPLRLSHAIWLMRPFMDTLTKLDERMSHKQYDRSVLVPLTQAVPNVMRALFEEVAPLWRHRCLILATQHPPTVSALRRRARRYQRKAKDVITLQREKSGGRRRQNGRTKPPVPRVTLRSDAPIKHGPPSDPSWPPFPIFDLARLKRTEAQLTAELPIPLTPASHSPTTVANDPPIIYAEGTLFSVFRKHAASDERHRSATIDQPTAARPKDSQVAEALPRGSPKPLPLSLPYVTSGNSIPLLVECYIK